MYSRTMTETKNQSEPTWNEPHSSRTRQRANTYKHYEHLRITVHRTYRTSNVWVIQKTNHTNTRKIMAVKTDMKKPSKIKRNPYSTILHNGLKIKNTTYPDPEIFRKIVSLGIDAESSSKDLETQRNGPTTPNGNLTRSLLTFSETYLKVRGKDETTLDNLKRSITEPQICKILNRMKNLLNANDEKIDMLREDCFSTIHDLGMMTLKMSRLADGRTDFYSTYELVFQQVGVNYTEGVESYFIKLLKKHNVDPSKFHEIMLISKFFADFCGNKQMLDNPIYPIVTNSIRTRILSSIDGDELNSLLMNDPELIKITETGSILQLCFSEKNLQTEDSKRVF